MYYNVTITQDIQILSVNFFKLIYQFHSHQVWSASINQENLFHYILDGEKCFWHKCLLFNHERRFTKLGYSAASTMLTSLPFLRTLVNKTYQATTMYKSSNFCYSIQNLQSLNLKCFLYPQVNKPFLHFVEVSFQQDIFKSLPKLYEDLSNGLKWALWMTRNIVHILTLTTQLLSFVVKLLTRSILPKFLFSKQGENMNLEIFARQVYHVLLSSIY